MLIVSNSPYWFMRTYICLYLFTPILNKFLQDVTFKQRLYALLVLGFISVYIGTITRCDFSLGDGKNLVYFALLYLVGNTLHVYNAVWQKFNTKNILALYAVLNISLFVLHIIAGNSFWGVTVWNLSFPYCSPFIILNSVLFIFLVAKRPFKNKVINHMASSSLAIYLIHGSHFGMNTVLKPIALSLHELANNELSYFILVCLLAFMVIAVCLSIDKMLTPLWRWINKLAYYLDGKCHTLICNRI